MMHLPARLFCRVFQTCFHLALPILPYHEPEKLGSIDALPARLRARGIGSVLLVTDPGLRAGRHTDALEAALTEAGIRVTVYDGTSANPTVDNVEAARALYLENRCEGLVAMGGGSSIDCAKAVGARIVHPTRSLDQLKGLLRVYHKLPPLAAIPTTAGTGSEVTITAVITDRAARHKYTMNNFTMIPAYAVLDPRVTESLPPSLTATTGMDALTHLVEAYIGRSTSRETRQLCRDAIALIFRYLERAYRDGGDLEAREGMLTAAYKAGIAFSKSYVGYIHAVAHSLGGQYNIPHGLANAVLMPVLLEAYGDTAHRKLAELAVAAGIAAEDELPSVAAQRLIDEIRAMNRRMGIPTGFSQIREADIPTMARHAAREANPLYPVPKLMDAGELEGFYRVVMAKGAAAEQRMPTAAS